MITYKYVVSDKQGLHATNAMSLSRAASEYESLELTVEGPDEGQASGFLKGLMRTIL